MVSHAFPPHGLGGAEVYANEHARALTAAGDDVVVLTRECRPASTELAVREDARDDGLRVVWINNTFRDVTAFVDGYRNPRIDAIANELIERFAPEVAHIHHLTCLSTGIVSLLRARHIPVFLTLHDYWMLCHRGQLLDRDYEFCRGPLGECGNCIGGGAVAPRYAYLGAAALKAAERRLPHSLAVGLSAMRSIASRAVLGALPANGGEVDRMNEMRRVLNQVTIALAPSRDLMRRFIAAGLPADRVVHSPYGFPSTDRRLAAREPGRPLRLGFVGSLMASKAPHVLLEAFARLSRGDATVDLYGAYAPYHGDDSYRGRLAPLLALRDVTVHGHWPHDDMAAAYAAMDVLVVTSIWPENSPLVIQEALLAGVPVIASDIGGIPELIQSGVNGLLFEAGSVDALHGILRRLVTEPLSVMRLRDAASRVRTIDDDVAALRQMYRDSLARPSSSLAIDAVVLNFQTADDTLIAVKSLLVSKRPLRTIYVVDNDPTGNCRTALASVWSRIVYLASPHNVGFSAGMNRGIHAALTADADSVLIVNSDITAPPDVLERLENALASRRDAAIAGPAILARAAPDRIASLGLSYSRSTGRMRHRHFGGHVDEIGSGAESVDAVSGCFMLIQRRAFELVGHLDEEYFFGFEDIDFCFRARNANLHTILVKDAIAYHEGSKSLAASSPERLYYAARNHLKLAKRLRHGNSFALDAARASFIVLLNVAYAVRSVGPRIGIRLAAVARGVIDHSLGRYGAGR